MIGTSVEDTASVVGVGRGRSGLKRIPILCILLEFSCTYIFWMKSCILVEREKVTITTVY